MSLLPVGAERRPTLQKEDFSVAYVRALVADLRGYVHKIEGDNDSIDMEIARHGYYSQERKRQVAPRSLRLQLKCTSDRFVPSRDHPDRFAKSLTSKNYLDLTAVDQSVKIILVVVQCPTRHEDRTRWGDRSLLLRGKAWWVDLERDYGHPGHGDLKPGQKDKTVYVPFRQRLTTAALSANMCSP